MKIQRALFSQNSARSEMAWPAVIRLALTRVAPVLVHSKVGLLLLGIMLFAGLSACRRTEEMEKVTLRLGAPHSVEWVGFYAAQLEGYYAAENLDVTILSADDRSPSEDVLSGAADFGVMSGGDLLLARTRSEPLVAISAILRRSPLAVMAFAETGITKPRDLRLKRVGVISSDMRTVKDVQFIALMEQVSVTLEGFGVVPVGEDGVMPLVNQRVDAIAYASAIREAVFAREAGYEFTLSYFSDYGVLEYPYVIFADVSTVEQRSDLTARFVRATLAGYHYALTHPARVAEMTSSYDPTLNMEEQQAIWQAVIPFLDTGDVLVGTMEEGVWQSTQTVFLNYGLMDTPVVLNDLYTNQFVVRSDY
ncbi:MAG: ABC transporter substrate-binding protein [Anaerolineae bacterium]|nr:ABC transporter substrate-binding protein [Anaerolineae bacterium]